MTIASIGASRRSGIALVATLFGLGNLLGGVANATTESVRQFVPTISPTCAATGSTSRFTAIITNASSSNRSLGSAILENDERPRFSHVGSFTAPVAANGGKAWKVLRDSDGDGDGLLLKATSSANALAPGESVSVTFSAKAPATPGIRTWRTRAFQGTTLFSSPDFSLAPGASQPTVNVVSPPPPCGGSVSVFCPSGTGCTSGPVQVGPPGSFVTVDVPPCPTTNGCDGNLTVFDSRDPTVGTGNTPCGSESTFDAVSSVTIQPPPGHTASDPPITVTFTDQVSVTGLVCKVDASHPDGQFLPDCGGETQSPPPCILSEVFGEGGSTIVVEMTSEDPVARH